jgi:hypothetical protein
MTISDRFDVVVLFPFSDEAGAKPRPALTVSRRQFNARHGAAHALGCGARRVPSGACWPEELGR